MMTNNQRIIAQQSELISKLSWNTGFGCYTRPGLEHVIWPEIAARTHFIVYFDVDGVHDLNHEIGEAAVDAKIKQVLSLVRATDYVAGQFHSGDEFCVCLTESDERSPVDPNGLVERLVDAFREQGMKATFAIVPVKSQDLLENVEPAVEMVRQHKQARGVTR